MDVAFKKVVEHIFNNWSALQLAVDHSMGGPNSKQVRLTFKIIKLLKLKAILIHI